MWIFAVVSVPLVGRPSVAVMGAVASKVAVVVASIEAPRAVGNSLGERIMAGGPYGRVAPRAVLVASIIDWVLQILFFSDVLFFLNKLKNSLIRRRQSFIIYFRTMGPRNKECEMTRGWIV